MKYLHSNKRKRKWKVAKHQDWKRWCEMSLKVLGSVENGECSGHLDPSLLSNSQPHWHPELGVNMKLDVHRWETEKGNVFRFGGGGGDQKGKFQLFSLHYGCYRKGLGSHLPGFRDSLATPFPWTNSWQQQGTPAPSHAPGWWVTHHEVSQRWRRCWEAHESLWTDFPPQDSSLGISFPIASTPGDLGHLQLWIPVAKTDPLPITQELQV